MGDVDFSKFGGVHRRAERPFELGSYLNTRYGRSMGNVVVKKERLSEVDGIENNYTISVEGEREIPTSESELHSLFHPAKWRADLTINLENAAVRREGVLIEACEGGGRVTRQRAGRGQRGRVERILPYQGPRRGYGHRHVLCDASEAMSGLRRFQGQIQQGG